MITGFVTDVGLDVVATGCIEKFVVIGASGRLLTAVLLRCADRTTFFLLELPADEGTVGLVIATLRKVITVGKVK